MGQRELEQDAVEEVITTEDKKIPNYKVLFLNDDFTTMDFVVAVLMHIFHKSPPEAEALMLKIHTEERAVVGIYHKEIAETKVRQTLEAAERNNFPLKVILEKE